MSRFTAAEKRECAEREARMREEVYPRRNRGRPLTRFQRQQIEMMREIAEDYRRLEPDLFLPDAEEKK